MAPLKIFYSYAHEDWKLRAELGKHLANCRAQGICQDWYDGDIVPGEEWDKTIKEKLRAADFILLLISADFMNSSYIASVEMSEAIERHEAGTAQVVPIKLRPCDISGAVFSKIQGLPTGLKAVTSWVDQDEAWTDVVRGLKIAFTKFQPARDGGRAAALPILPPLDGEIIRLGPQTQTATPASGLSTAEEENRALADTSTEGLEELGEWTANPTIQALVTKQKPAFDVVKAKLQVLVDYKQVHDWLHDLQFKCYNYVFQESRKLEEQIDWRLLVAPQKALEKILNSLEQAATQPSMRDEDFGWLKPLQTANDRLADAFKDFTITPLQEAATIIRTILEMRPAIFDTKLCAAAQTLPLEKLRRALSTIRDGLSPALLGSKAGKKFSAGIDALPELTDNLEALTMEHTRWQVIASAFWSIDALIDQSIDVLQSKWPDLQKRLETICGQNPAKRAVSIMESTAKLSQLLSQREPNEDIERARWQKRVRMAYTDCSNEGTTRFYQVDLSLKRFCDKLQEVQLALAKIF